MWEETSGSKFRRTVGAMASLDRKVDYAVLILSHLQHHPGGNLANGDVSHA
jgi:hypothetical protein